MTDTLGTLVRLRRWQAEQAKGGLALSAARERSAEAGLAAAEAAPAEQAALVRAEADPHAVGAYAAWLPRAARSIAACAEASQRAMAASEAARGELAVRQAALEAAELLAAEKRAVARKLAAARIQARLDEIGRTARSGR